MYSFSSKSVEASTKHTEPEEKLSISRHIPVGTYNPLSGLFNIILSLEVPSSRTTSKLPLSAIINDSCFLCAWPPRWVFVGISYK